MADKLIVSEARDGGFALYHAHEFADRELIMVDTNYLNLLRKYAGNDEVSHNDADIRSFAAQICDIANDSKHHVGIPKIKMIKLLRQITNNKLGLKEAKDLIESFE